MNESGKIIEFPPGGPKGPEAEREEPKAIEIGRFVSDEEGFKVFVRCELRGGRVSIEKFEGGENIAESLEKEGLVSPFGEKIFPKDGKKFLDLLRFNFRTPYLYAREKSPK